jgi:putative DNA primase/helicase
LALADANKVAAMLALVRKWTDSGFVDLTVVQTFLARDGSSKAPIIKPRLFRAGVGPVGADVWFGEPDAEREFIVAEGVESTLAAMRLIGAVDGCAALSALAIRELILPAAARHVCVFADNDEKKQSFEAARAAYRRWRDEGRDVRVMLPDRVGADANDLLRQRLGL